MQLTGDSRPHTGPCPLRLLHSTHLNHCSCDSRLVGKLQKPQSTAFPSLFGPCCSTRARTSPNLHVHISHHLLASISYYPPAQQHLDHQHLRSQWRPSSTASAMLKATTTSTSPTIRCQIRSLHPSARSNAAFSPRTSPTTPTSTASWHHHSNAPCAPLCSASDRISTRMG